MAITATAIHGATTASSADPGGSQINVPMRLIAPIARIAITPTIAVPAVNVKEISVVLKNPRVSRQPYAALSAPMIEVAARIAPYSASKIASIRPKAVLAAGVAETFSSWSPTILAASAG